MSFVPSVDEAREMLKKFNEEEFHLKHGEIVSGVMGYFAKEHDPEHVDYWRVVGMLHDLDFEQYPEELKLKKTKKLDLMKELDLEEGIIRSTCSHGYGPTIDIKPEHIMEKILFATDELTGLIGAVALMRPSKSVDDLELKSVKKKYKNLNFAAGCSREVIQQGADMLGWELDDLISQTILAMRSLNPELGI